MLSSETEYKWTQVPIRDAVIPNLDIEQMEAKNYWPKMVQINMDEFVLIGGGWHEGSTDCFKLNVRRRTLRRIKDLPEKKMAHQVIFIPAEKRYLKASKIFDKEIRMPFDFADDEYGDFFYKRQKDYD